MPEGTEREENAVALRNLFQRLLEHFSIEPSVISEGLNFAVEAPNETGRFLQEVVRDAVEAAAFRLEAPSFMFGLVLEAYRHDPTLAAVRGKLGLALLGKVILETEASPDDCVTALRDLGLLLNEGSSEVVKTVVNQVHYVESSMREFRRIARETFRE
jgi:hypothetical protein